MGKGTDKLYITHSEWSSSDAYSASAGANVSLRRDLPGSSLRRLPFNFCAASLQPFKKPVCTPEGIVFDAQVIDSWLDKHPNRNPVNGDSLDRKALIRLNFVTNPGQTSSGVSSDGRDQLVDPVTGKILTDHTHIVAIRHGAYANVFAWETVERMNVKAKMWKDLVDDEPFSRADIITLQNPHQTDSRNPNEIKSLRDGEILQSSSREEEGHKSSKINTTALRGMSGKIANAKAAVQRARRIREAAADPNHGSGRSAGLLSATSSVTHPATQDSEAAPNAASYTDGKAAASFTSTGLTPETSGVRALLSDEEFMLRPRRVKTKGYARIETSLGDLVIELHPESAPKAVWNFIRLARQGYYKGVVFHRNVPGFMIQGGDPTGTGKGGTSIWGKYFDDELDGPFTHDARGIVSMANKGKNTNSSQFFITYRPTPHLNRKHTIFGRIASGIEVLAKMESAPTNSSSRPLEDIVLNDVVVLIDPFDEFQANRREEARRLKERDELRRQGGTEDDKKTWTGKQIGGYGLGDRLGSKDMVGKYLKRSAEAEDSNRDRLDENAITDAWENEPVKKKKKNDGKSGGFGNFDSW